MESESESGDGTMSSRSEAEPMPKPGAKGDRPTANANAHSSEYVKLVSSDGHEFWIKRRHAVLSTTIQTMLEGPVLYNNSIRFRGIPSHVLRVICQYFAYKERYTECTTEIPEFPVAPEVALETLMAAKFFNC